MASTRTLRSGALALALLACGEADPQPEAPTPTAPAGEAPADPPPAPLSPADVRTDVLDRATLDALEDPQHGFSLATVLARLEAPEAAARGRMDLGWMSREVGAWRVLGSQLSRDLQAVIDSVQRPLVVELADALQYPAGNVGRAFDTRWLRSPDGHFELAGVVNRLDRRDLLPGETCGEVRLVYRLAYAQQRDGAPVGSRLPLTLNVVFLPASTDCAAVARQWAGLDDDAAALVAGPLAGLRLDRFEVNAQVVRFPSGLETEFAGQAIYLQRVYRLDEAEGGLTVVDVPLENTPDVARLRADDALRAELTAWLGANLADVDRGTYRVPERFLAKTALSWSTLGVNRLANRPFSAIYADRLDELPDPAGLAGARFIGSRRGLIERLDNGSCAGCHQAGSTAGFHLLGPDGASAGITNRLASPVSPHLAEERLRRKQYVSAVASGQEPDRLRAHSLAPNFGMKGYVDVGANQACLPEAHTSDVAPESRWRCAAGRCRVVAADPKAALNWGQCVPDDVADVTAGQTCRAGTITSTPPGDGVWNQHATADTVALTQLWDLAEDKTFAVDAYNCRPTRIGVPLGRLYRRCTEDERTLEHVRGERGGLDPEICAVVGGTRFDQCVERDFHACLEEIVGRGMVATCGPDLPCREDAICQALPWQLEGVPDAAGRALAEAGVGFCTPTYFLFQLRLDGHPVPTVAGG